MLKIKVDKDTGIEIEANGTGLEITTEMANVVASVHDAIQENSESDALIFATAIISEFEQRGYWK